MYPLYGTCKKHSGTHTFLSHSNDIGIDERELDSWRDSGDDEARVLVGDGKDRCRGNSECEGWLSAPGTYTIRLSSLTEDFLRSVRRGNQRTDYTYYIPAHMFTRL